MGSHTIGIALSDELGLTAQGLETIRRKSADQDLKELTRIVTTYQVTRIVVGLPMNMNGTLGPQAEKVLEWKRTLEKHLTLPVETWDERLSTVGATRVLLEADVSRRKENNPSTRSLPCLSSRDTWTPAGNTGRMPLFRARTLFIGLSVFLLISLAWFLFVPPSGTGLSKTIFFKKGTPLKKVSTILEEEGSSGATISSSP